MYVKVISVGLPINGYPPNGWWRPWQARERNMICLTMVLDGEHGRDIMNRRTR